MLKAASGIRWSCDCRPSTPPLHAFIPVRRFLHLFNEADVVAIAEVFAAGEDPIEGASRDDLVAGLIRHGHRRQRTLNEDDRNNWCALTRNRAISSCLGHSTISAWANAMPDSWGNSARFKTLPIVRLASADRPHGRRIRTTRGRLSTKLDSNACRPGLSS